MRSAVGLCVNVFIGLCAQKLLETEFFGRVVSLLFFCEDYMCRDFVFPRREKLMKQGVVVKLQPCGKSVGFARA